jgi:hypothetical protein
MMSALPVPVHNLAPLLFMQVFPDKMNRRQCRNAEDYEASEGN